jgi:hypothetical protein
MDENTLIKANTIYVKQEKLNTRIANHISIVG